MAAPVRIRVASALAVEHEGRILHGRDLGSRKARTLLALLAAERGHGVTVDRIVEALWHEAPPADPPANVATLASRLRARLGADVIAGTGRTYGLLGGSAWVVDLDEAVALCEEAEARVAAGERAVAATAARRVLVVLGNAVALADEDDADWVLGVRRDADGLRRRARHLLSLATEDSADDEAVRVAAEAVAADVYDERAVRDLMRALVADGRTTAALTAYDALAARLRDDLGTDPDRATEETRLAVLRGVPPDQAPATDPGQTDGRAPSRPTLIGREHELRVADAAWRDTCAGRGSLLLVEGEAGIGKTRLIEAITEGVARTGGRVLRTRCHPTESSLFLQPFVEALRPVLLDLEPAAAEALVRGHAAPLVALLPELGDLVSAPPDPPATPALQRRRAHDAVAAVLRRLSRQAPILLSIDDLQYGGTATVDLLGYLAGRLAGSAVLLVGAVRVEDRAHVERLEDRATVLELGALPRSAVDALAAATGLAAQGAVVMERTAGHALSVIECLRALAAGDTGVPHTLSQAVLARVGRLEPASRALVEAAAVLGGRLDPRVLAHLVDATEVDTAQRCEGLVRHRLLDRVGTHYEFTNDLAQECVHAALAPALAVAYHRRAADLLAHQPESMALHALAAGEPERAARGWLLAGEQAMSRSAIEDAGVLLDRALAAAEEPTTRGRVLLARARALEARTAYDAALVDVDKALALARGCGDLRLEMAALRARGGDITVALHQSTAETTACLEDGLRLAERLGDRTAEADFTGRLSILEASTLHLGPGLARAQQNLARCRARGSADALVRALDAAKTILAALADPAPLREVVEELEPMLRSRRETWWLQWTVYESSFVPAAEGDWASARERVATAIELNRSSGYPAYAGFFRAHGGLFERLAGDLDAALVQGRRSVEQSARIDHPWWHAAAAGLYAATLIEAGRLDDAAAVAARGLASTSPGSAPAWRLRCLAPLAYAGGDADVLAEATRLVAAIETPPGSAWLAGADVYLLVARAWAARDPARAAAILEPLRLATRTAWAPVHDRVDEVLAQISSATS